jgi:hypothetical protein
MLKNIFLIILIIILIKFAVTNNNTNDEHKLKEDFTNIIKIDKDDKFKLNNLYYGLPCNYIKNDAFYTILDSYGFKITTDITEASLIVPCTYENISDEIKRIEDNKISNNKFNKNVRIYMINNTDYMVSKILLWVFIVEKYGNKIASQIMPYTWYIESDEGFNDFKKVYDKNKLYITKNNAQRQEGLEIQNDIENINKTRDKYILIQELLQDPYCINGRKINLRVYCLLVKDTLGNVKIQLYRDGFMYYTAEPFEKNSKDFKKNITTGYIDRQIYIDNPLTHEDFRKYLDSNRELSAVEKYIKQTNKLSDYIFEKIYAQLKLVLEVFVDKLGDKNNGISFQLYGADIGINDSLKPLLMEINKGPDLTFKDERDGNLKKKLAEDMLKSIGLIENDSKNNFITVYERISINDKIYEIDFYPK